MRAQRVLREYAEVCVCVCDQGRWMRSSRMKMMTAKQRRNKTANTTKQCQICSNSVVSRNSPGAEGRAELSFIWAACGATCALRCGICIGVLTEAEVGLATSEPERRGGAELRNRRTGDGPRHPRSKPKSRREAAEVVVSELRALCAVLQ